MKEDKSIKVSFADIGKQDNLPKSSPVGREEAKVEDKYEIVKSLVKGKYMTLIAIETLQTYCDFPIEHVGVMRAKVTLSELEKEYLSCDDPIIDGIIVGMALPSEDGFILCANEHTKIVLLDKDFKKHHALEPMYSKEANVVGFMDYEQNFNPDDYEYYRAVVSGEVKDMIKETWFKESTPNDDTKLN